MRAQHDDGRIVLFNRGWVPQEQKDPAKRAQGQVAARVDLTGIVRRNQERRQFAPENVPDKNVWFHVDVPLMRGMAGGKPDPKLDTFFLDADAAPNPGGLPIGGRRVSTSPTTICSTPSLVPLALRWPASILAYHWENGRLTVAAAPKSSHDRQRSLCRARTPLRTVGAVIRQLESELGPLDQMPPGASEDRADHSRPWAYRGTADRSPRHARVLSRRGGGGKGLDRWRAANLREMRRLWVHESALPADLVEARTRAASACEMVWREAKKNADFKSCCRRSARC